MSPAPPRREDAVLHGKMTKKRICKRGDLAFCVDRQMTSELWEGAELSSSNIIKVRGLNDAVTNKLSDQFLTSFYLAPSPDIS